MKCGRHGGRRVPAQAGVNASGLFQRGSTQVLSPCAPSATPAMAQEMTTSDPMGRQTYLHHYNSPLFVGETRPMRLPRPPRSPPRPPSPSGPLIPVLPAKGGFPLRESGSSRSASAPTASNLDGLGLRQHAGA